MKEYEEVKMTKEQVIDCECDIFNYSLKRGIDESRLNAMFKDMKEKLREAGIIWKVLTKY